MLINTIYTTKNEPCHVSQWAASIQLPLSRICKERLFRQSPHSQVHWSARRFQQRMSTVVSLSANKACTTCILLTELVRNHICVLPGNAVGQNLALLRVISVSARLLSRSSSFLLLSRSLYIKKDLATIRFISKVVLIFIILFFVHWWEKCEGYRAPFPFNLRHSARKAVVENGQWVVFLVSKWNLCAFSMKACWL